MKSFSQKKSLLLLLVLAAIFVCLNGCADTAAPEKANPMGLKGRYAPEAETNFALARVLWSDPLTCSDPALAIEYLDKAIAAAPDYEEAYARRGLAKSDLRDWDGAFDDLTKAIRLNPAAQNYAYRGLISMRGGNSLGAARDFDRSISLDSKQHRAWNFRGGLHVLTGDYTKACKDFERGCSNGDCTGLESAKGHGYCR
ncbi:hypothetical protein LJC36_00450 [Desulfovibrio sp. OttesenSCG-928-C14]|nr:hypothetical protein [Desulfovibrio sp. OttesenSCG-928-C14]